MKITVLLGNGFDVSLGIKSSYGDFYKWYYDKPSEIKHIQDFRRAIKEDILRDVPDEEKTWADFELGLGIYTENFTKETVDQYIDCLDDAQTSIREYLLQQEKAFDVAMCTKKSIASFQNSLWSFFDEISDLEKASVRKTLNDVPGQDREISFITFNYTNTLERILRALPEEPLSTWKHNGNTYKYTLGKSVLHVHGTTEQFPVLGVNEESQITKKELLETPQFRELLIKAENVRALGMLWHNQAEEQISNSKIVCVLGMSLGATDAKWWRKLIQWLKADNSRHIILYWFEKNPPNGISTVKQLRTVDAAKNKLLLYTNNLSANEISALKSRIHVVINTQKYLHLEKRSPAPYNPLAEAVEAAQFAAEHQEEIRMAEKYMAEHGEENAVLVELLSGVK